MTIPNSAISTFKNREHPWSIPTARAQAFTFVTYMLKPYLKTENRH